MMTWKKWGGFFVLILASLLLYGAFSSERFSLFIGRFHVLLIHFPIVLLLLAGFVEMVRQRSGEEAWSRTLSLLLPLTAGASVVAAATGYLLSFESDSASSALYWHLRLGFFVATGSTLTWVLWLIARRRKERIWSRSFRSLLLLSVLGVVGTGHFGGVLAHGSQYLTQYLPSPLLPWLGHDSLQPGDSSPATQPIYTELVHPILQRRCVSCHGEAKKEGDLDLESYDRLQAGGEEGEVFVAGEPRESEIIRRVSHPPGHPDRMPPEGQEPLTIAEIELLRWWIALGASPDQTILSAEERPFTIETILSRRYGPLPEPKKGIFALQVEEPSSSALRALEEAGFEALPLAEGVPFLQVQLPRGERFDSVKGQALQQAAEQVAWLDLSGVEFESDAARFLSELPHLARLNLSQSDFENSDLKHLAGQEHLEYLNLFGCDISNEGLEKLESLPSLQALYLWGTEVTTEGVSAFQSSHPEVEVNLGSGLAPADSNGDPFDSERADPRAR